MRIGLRRAHCIPLVAARQSEVEVTIGSAGGLLSLAAHGQDRMRKRRCWLVLVRVMSSKAPGIVALVDVPFPAVLNRLQPAGIDAGIVAMQVQRRTCLVQDQRKHKHPTRKPQQPGGGAGQCSHGS